ncbi:hypothetical protein EJ07DRAFT_116876, partial [Lizonia empirigonia]
DCTITWPAIEGDTCASMARNWALKVDVFQAMNSTADCSKLVPGQEYCVNCRFVNKQTSQIQHSIFDLI